MTLLHDQLAHLPVADETARARRARPPADILRPSGARRGSTRSPCGWPGGNEPTGRPSGDPRG